MKEDLKTIIDQRVKSLGTAKTFFDKENLRAVPVEMGASQEYLKNIIHRSVTGTDITLAAVYVIESNENSRASYQVTEGHLSGFGLTETELMDKAISNSIREGALVMPLHQRLAGLMGSEEIGAMMTPEGQKPVILVTNDTGMFGSTLIASDDILKTVHEQIGDFYILPSSRHEFLCLSTDAVDDVKELGTMVHDINLAVVEPEDRLSGSIYCYDGQTLSTALQDEYTVEMTDDVADFWSDTMDAFENDFEDVVVPGRSR